MANDTRLDPAPLTQAPPEAAASPPPGAATGLCGRPLGEILVATTRLPAPRVEEALALQRGEHAGQRLGEILVRLRAVSEEEVLRALAIQLDLPFLERIDPEAVPAELVAKVPSHFAKQARVLPLGEEGGAVRVAVADPLDTAAQDSMSMLLGAPVTPEIAP